MIDVFNQSRLKGLIGKGAIIHTDQGSRYASVEYRRLLYVGGFRQPMSRKGNCYDNAQAESFFSRLKAELLENGRFESLEQARSEVFSYIEGYYNRVRLHSSLGYKSPVRFEKEMKTTDKIKNKGATRLLCVAKLDHLKLHTLAELDAMPPPVCTSERLRWNGFKLERYFVASNIQRPESCFSSNVIGIVIGGEYKNSLPVIGGRREVTYRRNDAVLLPANFSSIGHDPREMDLLTVYLEPDFVERAARDLIGGERVELVPRFKLNDAFVFEFSNYLLREAETGGESGSLYAESLATALAIRLVKHHSAAKIVSRKYAGGLPKYKLRCVIEYINANLDAELSLAALAAECDISIYHFARMFKSSTGLAPHQFVVRQRIERAKQLLRETNLTVGEIAYQIGFADQSHFTKIFRRHTGATPVVFKLQFR